MATQPTERSRHPFSAALGVEWARMRRSGRHLSRIRGWSERASMPPSPTLDRLAATTDDLQQIVDATCRSRPDGEAVLRRLIALAGDDPLAARIVLQRVTPLVISAASRFGRYHAEDPAELALPMAWVVIRTFDWRTRRGPVATIVTSDVVYATFRRDLRRPSTNDLLRPLSAFSAVPASHVEEPALVELAAVVRDAKEAGVDDEDLDVLRDIVRREKIADVAAERGVTTRTIRNHRRRAVESVRAAIAA